MLDTSSRVINAETLILNNLLIKDNTLTFSPSDSENTNSQQIRINSNESTSRLILSRASEVDISEIDSAMHGAIIFNRTDINGSVNTGNIFSFNNSLVFAANPTGDYSNESSFLSFWFNKLGIGKVQPEKKLDVNGDAIIRGETTISGGLFNSPSFTEVERDDLSPQNGSLIYNLTTNKFQGYTNGTWIDLH
jgi:hypothetical protein